MGQNGTLTNDVVCFCDGLPSLFGGWRVRTFVGPSTGVSLNTGGLSHAVCQSCSDKALGREPKLAMGQNPVPPVNIPIPTTTKKATKKNAKMGGEFTYPKMEP